ncbi:hypothetical protein Tco_0121439 [Tanacetum coccineum]
MLFSQSPTGLYRPTMESSTSSHPNHPYFPVNRINLDMDFEQNIFSQDYNYSQDYSMGYGSSHCSAHGSAHGSAPVNDDVEDDSPVEEVSPVKHKKPSRRAARAKKDAPKEPPKDWTVAEETALCKLGAMVRPRIDAFCAIIHNVEANHESGTNDLDVYHKACAEYKMIYKQDFTLEHCYNVLKDHQASGGIDLNDEADEETEELQPMGRDRSKAKKKSAGSSRADLFIYTSIVEDKLSSRGSTSVADMYQTMSSGSKLSPCSKYWLRIRRITLCFLKRLAAPCLMRRLAALYCYPKA